MLILPFCLNWSEKFPNCTCLFLKGKLAKLYVRALPVWAINPINIDGFATCSFRMLKSNKEIAMVLNRFSENSSKHFVHLHAVKIQLWQVGDYLDRFYFAQIMN